MTDTPEDDCVQNKTVRSYGMDWNESPLSKIYIKKSSDVMKALGDRLIVEV